MVTHEVTVQSSVIEPDVSRRVWVSAETLDTFIIAWPKVSEQSW